MNKIYICTCDYCYDDNTIFYGSGIAIVSASNAFKAMKLIKDKCGNLPFKDHLLEEIVGSTYEGDERIIKYSVHYD